MDWRSIKEIEHNGVAYNIFLHAIRTMPPSRRAWIQRWAMLLTTLHSTQPVRETTLMLLNQDNIAGWKARAGLFRWLQFKPDLYRRLVNDYACFFRPGFHPWQIDDRSLTARADANLAMEG